MSKLKSLEEKLGYQFISTALLERALTHRSSVGKKNNERLEFLGDALLGHIIAEALFIRHPDASEGELSRMRSTLVRGDHLADTAKEYGFSDHLKLGAGEKKSGGNERISILANTFEAVVGAIYLDGGFDACRKVIITIFDEKLNALPESISTKDAKSTLQEWLQAHKMPLPEYSVKITGEAHAQTFHVTCTAKGLPYKTQGTSSSRRKAEQAAAKAFLELIDEQSK